MSEFIEMTGFETPDALLRALEEDTYNYGISDEIPLLRDAMYVMPEHHGIILQLAIRLSKTREDDEAATLFYKAESLKPNDPETLDEYARFLRKTDEFDAAEVRYAKLYKQEGENVPFILDLGLLYEQSGETELAYTCYKYTLSLKNRQDSGIQERIDRLQLDEPPKAKWTDIVSRLNEKLLFSSPKIILEKVKNNRRRTPEKLEQEIAFLEKGLKIFPDDADIQFELAVKCSIAKKDDRAKELYEELFQQNPDNAEIMLEYARFHKKISKTDLQKLENVEEVYAKLYALSSTNKELRKRVLSGLGDLYYRMAGLSRENINTIKMEDLNKDQITLVEWSMTCFARGAMGRDQNRLEELEKIIQPTLSEEDYDEIETQMAKIFDDILKHKHQTALKNGNQNDDGPKGGTEPG